MERDGLLTVGPDRIIELSPAGRTMAERVMRKHRLAECMLVELLDLDWELVHAEACRWEHVISEDVERRLVTILGNPTVSPFGNPIPALDELVPHTSATPDDSGHITLLDAAGDEISYVSVQRIEETAQEDPRTLASFHRAGMLVGAVVKCRRTDGAILVGSGGEYTDISPRWPRTSGCGPPERRRRPMQLDDTCRQEVTNRLKRIQGRSTGSSP